MFRCIASLAFVLLNLSQKGFCYVNSDRIIRKYGTRYKLPRISSITAPAEAASSPIEPSVTDRNKELDQKILKLAGPAVLNFMIIPLVGAVDTYWVGRMRNVNALAGQGAANQVFNSAFWIISFLPNVLTPLVAQAAGSGNKEEVQNRMGEAVFLGTIMGSIGMIILTLCTKYVLSSVLPGATSSVTAQYAFPYLQIRGFTFIPAILTTIGLAGFRGTMDVVTPLKISAFSNLVNLILDPILMFTCNMGIGGAALATCISEMTSFVLYMYLLFQRQLLQWKKVLVMPSFNALLPLLKSGFIIQLRAIALNISFLAVTRTTQSLDSSGVSAAAHAVTLQLWQLTGTILLAMSSVASVLVPNERAKARQQEAESNLPNTYSLEVAKYTADRLIRWGLLSGLILGSIQLTSLPLLSILSPLKEVQATARGPAIIGALLQMMNGVVFVGEGIQQGNQCFTSLAVSTVFATIGMLLSLRFVGKNLIGVWCSFAVFNFIRLLGVIRHHYFTGPLARKSIDKMKIAMKTV